MQVNRAATMQLQADASVREAAEKMQKGNIGLLLLAEDERFNEWMLGYSGSGEVLTCLSMKR